MIHITITDNNVYIDGQRINFESSDFSGLRILNFQHKKHMVTIQSLVNEPSQEEPLVIHGQGSFERRINPSDILG